MSVNAPAPPSRAHVQERALRELKGRVRRQTGGGEMTVTDCELNGKISSAGGGIHIREAPEGAHLSTGGGEIYVRNALRFVTARTGGGDITIEVENGWVEASTGAGDIDVEVIGSLGDRRRGVELVTGLGEVTVTLPADISAELDLELGYTCNSSRDYEINSDFPIEIEHTREWDYDHGTPRRFIWGTGKIGDGQHLIRIVSTNGDIRIRSAK